MTKMLIAESLTSEDCAIDIINSKLKDSQKGYQYRELTQKFNGPNKFPSKLQDPRTYDEIDHR